MKKFLSLLFAIILLSGCATTNNTHSSKDDTNACIASIKGKARLLIVDVPSADNFISNKLIVASVKTTGSTTIDTLINLMSLPTRPSIIVTGDNDDVTAATLEAALLRLPKGKARSCQQVCFAGAREYGASLKTAAEGAGIHLVMPTTR